MAKSKSKSKSKSKPKTLSFILEVALEVKPHEEAVLNKRFEAARQFYNACLHEAKRRLDLLRQSKEFQKAKRMPKTINGKINKERTLVFKTLNTKFGFSEYALHSYTTKLRKSSTYIIDKADHIDSVTAQTLATRAFLAIQRVALGKAKSVRFKGKNQLKSIEGKSNKAAIRFINCIDKKETASDHSDYSDCYVQYVQWNGLKLKCIIDVNDKIALHGLGCKVKYCRIVKRLFNGKTRFFVQLVLKGIPYQKHKFPKGEVGLDIGPSTIAYVSENDAKLENFCSELKDKQKEVRKLQRKLDRSRRSTNSQNYNMDGTSKRGKNDEKSENGKLKWNFSRRYQKVRQKLEEIQRKQKAHRKSLHGEMANRILKNGNHIKTEKLSYKAFQKMFGKSVQFRAPGMFMTLLRRKAESAGGVVEEFPTRETKLSQYCNVCEEYHKKPLSQRWHTCCGMQVQRDLYSAYLALHVKVKVKENSLDTTAVKEQWSSMESVLVQAVSKNKNMNVQTASGKHQLPALA